MAAECTELLVGHAGAEGFCKEGKTQFVWQNVSLGLWAEPQGRGQELWGWAVASCPKAWCILKGSLKPSVFEERI